MSCADWKAVLWFTDFEKSWKNIQTESCENFASGDAEIIDFSMIPRICLINGISTKIFCVPMHVNVSAERYTFQSGNLHNYLT